MLTFIVSFPGKILLPSKIKVVIYVETKKSQAFDSQKIIEPQSCKPAVHTRLHENYTDCTGCAKTMGGQNKWQ